MVEDDKTNKKIEAGTETDKVDGKVQISFLPSIKYYLQTYAKSMGDNDAKAVKVFMMFEPQERLRRFQQEIIMVKDELVKIEVCNTTIGKKRAVKYNSYSQWAKNMLLWLIEAKK